jgi:hypothetical protein
VADITRVNKPENDDPSILEPVELATDGRLTDAEFQASEDHQGPREYEAAPI